MTPSRSPEPPAKPTGHHAEAAGKAVKRATALSITPTPAKTGR